MNSRGPLLNMNSRGPLLNMNSRGPLYTVIGVLVVSCMGISNGSTVALFPGSPCYIIICTSLRATFRGSRSHVIRICTGESLGVRLVLLYSDDMVTLVIYTSTGVG